MQLCAGCECEALPTRTEGGAARARSPAHTSGGGAARARSPAHAHRGRGCESPKPRPCAQREGLREREAPPTRTEGRGLPGGGGVSGGSGSVGFFQAQGPMHHPPPVETGRTHLRASEGTCPCDTLIMDFWPPELGERINFCCRKSPSCDPLSQWPQDTDTSQQSVRPRPPALRCWWQSWHLPAFSRISVSFWKEDSLGFPLHPPPCWAHVA